MVTLAWWEFTAQVEMPPGTDSEVKLLPYLRPSICLKLVLNENVANLHGSSAHLTGNARHR